MDICVKIRDQTKDQKTLFLPKISAIHNSKAGPFGYRQKEEKSLSFDL